MKGVVLMSVSDIVTIIGSTIGLLVCLVVFAVFMYSVYRLIRKAMQKKGLL